MFRNEASILRRTRCCTRARPWKFFFNMQEIVLGEPASEWRCTGHVVRVEAIAPTGGKLGVGVQFDSYEVARSKPTDWATRMAMPQRMIADTGYQ